MHNSAVVRACAAALLSLCPLALRADFAAPRPDELKMTAEPKAPGAAAVYLDREQTTIDGHHYTTLYERIKVLTDKGRKLATVRIPYEHGEFVLREVEGRTIHPDGTIVPLAVKPSDLVEFKSRGYQENNIVFTLPDVEVGSILEYRVKFSYDVLEVVPPIWHVQQVYFTREAHFQFQPSGGMGGGARFTTNLPDPTKIKADKHGFTLDLTDVPALPDEDWMPPLNVFNWKVRFTYSVENNDSDFWRLQSGYWAQAVDEFIKTTPLLTKTAQELALPTDTPMQKATKIYAAVMKLENTGFTRERTDAERKKEKLRTIKKAEDIWRVQMGNPSHIALLYMALARADGLTVYPLQLVNRDRAIFDPHFHSTDQLDDYLVILALDGKEIILDPGEKMCPFGSLHWRHNMATGLRGTVAGPKVINTPAGSYKGSSVDRIAELEVAADGSVTGSLRIVMSGPEALHWRQIAVAQDDSEVKKRFDTMLNEMVPEGVHADFDHFLQLDDYNTVLVATAKVSGTLGIATGRRLFLPGLFFESHAKHYFLAQEKRVTPIDVHYPQTTSDEVTYNLPAGIAPESLPAATNIAWPQHAVLKIAAKPEGNSVEITRTLSYNYAVLGPSDYPDLHDFYEKISSADQQQLVLHQGAATVAENK